MATRKVKRYADEGLVDEFGDLEGAIDAANTREVLAQFDANERAKAAPAAKVTPKAESKPAAAPSKPAASSSQGSGFTRMSKEAGEAAQAKFREPSKPAPKKEMYRGFDGKMHEKAPDTSAADAAARREKFGAAVKGVGEYLSGLGKREEKHGTYRTLDGKVVKYARGGMTASKRADGIAQRGKTRGKMY